MYMDSSPFLMCTVFMQLKAFKAGKWSVKDGTCLGRPGWDFVLYGAL